VESKPATVSAPKPAAKPAAKLGYKEQRELAALPGQIEKLEAEQEKLTAELGDGSIYQRDNKRALAVQERLGVIGSELTAAYERWEALEAQR
jgi:ATP-binding cassette subfamily F protein uup